MDETTKQPITLSSSLPPGDLRFITNGKPIVTIHPDMTVTLHDGATVDDGARAFWEAVIRMAPKYGFKP